MLSGYLIARRHTLIAYRGSHSTDPDVAKAGGQLLSLLFAVIEESSVLVIFSLPCSTKALLDSGSGCHRCLPVQAHLGRIECEFVRQRGNSADCQETGGKVNISLAGHQRACLGAGRWGLLDTLDQRSVQNGVAHRLFRRMLDERIGQ